MALCRNLALACRKTGAIWLPAARICARQARRGQIYGCAYRILTLKDGNIFTIQKRA
jgi:hypothetical protein